MSEAEGNRLKELSMRLSGLRFTSVLRPRCASSADTRAPVGAPREFIDIEEATGPQADRCHGRPPFFLQITDFVVFPKSCYLSRREKY